MHKKYLHICYDCVTISKLLIEDKELLCKIKSCNDNIFIFLKR